MLWFGSWIVFFVFCFYTVRLARYDSVLLALGFVAAWLIGRLGLPLLGIEGSIYFVAFAATLSLIMILIDRYRDQMGLRRPTPSPLEELTKNDCENSDRG